MAPLPQKVGLRLLPSDVAELILEEVSPAVDYYDAEQKMPIAVLSQPHGCSSIGGQGCIQYRERHSHRSLHMEDDFSRLHLKLDELLARVDS
eukprot:292144-Amphidinium_carterae.1